MRKSTPEEDFSAGQAPRRSLGRGSPKMFFIPPAPRAPSPPLPSSEPFKKPVKTYRNCHKKAQGREINPVFEYNVNNRDKARCGGKYYKKPEYEKRDGGGAF